MRNAIMLRTAEQIALQKVGREPGSTDERRRRGN